MIEERYGPFRSRAYLLAEEVEGPDALAYFTSVKPDPDQCRNLGRALVDLIVQMGQAWLIQRDTKAKNFIISPNGPILIDLDGIEHYRWSYTFNRAYKNCWQPLMESWKHYPEAYVLFRDLLKQAGIDYE